MIPIKYILALTIIFGVAFALELESNFYSEESCSAVKGYCVLENECPQKVEKSYKELCPNQKSGGAVCCKNFPADKVNCFQSHNSCEDTCLERLNRGRKGCLKNQVCCVLI